MSCNFDILFCKEGEREMNQLLWLKNTRKVKWQDQGQSEPKNGEKRIQ